jgi:PAS domain-containing protein
MKRSRLTRPDIQLRLDRQGIIRDVTLTPGLPEEAIAAWQGQSWIATVDPADAEQLRQVMAQLRDGDMAAYLHISQRFPDGSEVPVEYVACRTGGQGGILVTGRTRPVLPEAEGLQAGPLLDRMPDGFVALDAHGHVQRANRAFLDMAQCGAEGSILGESLERWLHAPGADLAVLLATLAQHGAIRLFAARLTGSLGCEREVEISGTLHEESGRSVIGLVIRDIARRLLPSGEATALKDALEGLASEVGRVPLPTIVRDTSALLERACIEEALRQSGGNRTAAADMLGLSRQSLYAKLDRYRLDDRAVLASR